MGSPSRILAVQNHGHGQKLLKAPSVTAASKGSRNPTFPLKTPKLRWIERHSGLEKQQLRALDTLGMLQEAFRRSSQLVSKSSRAIRGCATWFGGGPFTPFNFSLFPQKWSNLISPIFCLRHVV